MCVLQVHGCHFISSVPSDDNHCSGRNKIFYLLSVCTYNIIMSCVYCSGAFDDVIMMSSLQGRPMEFVDVDDNNKQWVNDFSSKQISVPHRLENMES